jgi:hypothetical protein
MCLSRSFDFFKLLVKHPFMMGVRPQLIVVSGLSVGIPLTVGFRPQLVVVSGLLVWIPLTVGFRLSRSLWLSRSPFQAFLSHDGISAITEPFMNFSLTRWNLGYHEAFLTLFFHTIESRLSRSLFTNFSFSWWNSGYHEAFSRTFLFHDGILAITKPFHELFFFTMEFWLSRSLFTNHDGILAIKEPFTRYNSQNARIGGKLFSYISQRVFTQDPPRQKPCLLI